MMEMDEEFLEINDLDWFASSQDGLLAHFATGGRGYVPLGVRRSISIYEDVYDYFFSLDGGVGVEIVEKNLPVFADIHQRERYLQPFLYMASKGLFSYDANGVGYCLIAKPYKNRTLHDLPVSVKGVIHTLPLRFSAKIDMNDFL